MPPMFMARPNGPRIRELRVARRWTQRQLARQIKRTHQVISKAESGEPVSLTLLRQIAGTLDVDLAEIEIVGETVPEDQMLQRTG
jgi:transcriptional regulator with XRE-family HTH domain